MSLKNLFSRRGRPKKSLDPKVSETESSALKSIKSEANDNNKMDTS